MKKYVTPTEARKRMYSLVQEVAETYNPVIITNRKGQNVVMVPEEEWSGIQETLYLYSIPGMVDSILKAAKEPTEEMVEYTDDFWDKI